MASNIVELNNNIIINANYSIEFFDFRDYTLKSDDFSMSDWKDFINNTETFTLPLIEITSYTKNQKIWYRNTSPLYDKVSVSMDASKQNNLMEFVARKAKYNNIVLDDLKMLGAIVKMNYLSNDHQQKSRNLFVGRISVAANTDKLLSLTLDQLNKILSKSDFEKYVVQSPTASFYNYISIKQAFENIYNAPHNIIDEKSYPISPFKLDESSYLPISAEDITLRDDNFLANNQIYAEDYVANTTKNIHCQFYYNDSDPSCGYKMTEYDENKEVVNEESFNVMNWNVWGNTESAIANWSIGDGFEKDIILNYQRYFRPFKVAIAGEEEVEMLDYGNYRTKRDYVYPNYEDYGEASPLERQDPTFYDTTVENYIFEQKKILPGENEACRLGDTLVYFEQLGDVRMGFSASMPSVNVLYDNYSIIWVYNQRADIVYFDHISTFVQSTPLPKKWLDMQLFIRTDEIYFASRLNYDSQNNHTTPFVSQIKPLCAVHDENSYPGDGYGARTFVASENSYKTGQNSDGEGGTFVGEKLNLPYVFGTYDLGTTAGYDSAVLHLDYIQKYNKPKSVRISDDGKTIYFLKGVKSEFTTWDPDFIPHYIPEKVKTTEYNKVTEFPTVCKWIEKDLYITKSNGTVAANQKEYTRTWFVNYDFAVTENTPLFTELSNDFSANSLLLMDSNRLGLLNVVNGHSRIMRITSDSLIGSTPFTISTDKTTPSVNFFTYNSEVYWVKDRRVRKGFDSYYFHDSDEKILDFYKDATKETAIIQTPIELEYHDLTTNTIIYSKSIIGFEYILSCDREEMLFINPLKDKSNEIIRVAQVTNESVRLLSFKGNRYIAGDRLASSFFKNSFYDGDGILNIGYVGDKIIINDDDVTTISTTRYRYDALDFAAKAIELNGFAQLDNTVASNKEEDDLEYNKKISIEMTSNRDIKLNFTISRTGTDSLLWEATNEFGTESETITETGFNSIEIDLTGKFEGISIECNFFNTSLAQGEKFRGVIERRKYINDVAPTAITTSGGTNIFPFVDDSTLSLDLPFVYEKNKEAFKEVVQGYFIDDSKIREVVEMQIEIPCLLLFNDNYETFNPSTIITLSSGTKYNKGYKLLSNTEVEEYSDNTCDYYIEKMKLNRGTGTTTLNLVSV